MLVIVVKPFLQAANVGKVRVLYSGFVRITLITTCSTVNDYQKTIDRLLRIHYPFFFIAKLLQRGEVDKTWI